MTVFEPWELDAVIFTMKVPGLTFMLEIVIIFNVSFVCKFSETVLVETRPI